MRKRLPLLAGAGAGKGGGAGPTQTPDTLRSNSYAKVVDLISEGPILGFVDDQGNVLADAFILTQPTIVGGVVQNNAVIGYGGLGYPANEDFVNTGISIVDPEGTGSGCKGFVTIVNGVITALSLSGGSNYTGIQIDFPSVIGKGILLNNLVLQNDDLTFNFTGLSYTSRLGSQNQAPMRGFSDTENAHQIGLAFTHIQPVSFTVSDPTADTCVIGVQVANLYTQDQTTGDISGTSVTYKITLIYQADNVTHPEVGIAVNTITGKSITTYTQQSSINLVNIRDPDATNHIYTFKCYRITPDALAPYTSTATVNPDNAPILINDQLTFQFLTMITNVSLSYPNSALVGLSVDAMNFSSVPTRGYRIKGLQVMVPTNYFPNTRLYNRNLDGSAATDDRNNPIPQVWDGSMYLAWTDNPAWCFYDIVTNTRYGLGADLNSGIYGIADKFSLYTVAQYCDGLVPDGFGGMEPRFTCNLYLQSREDAYKVLQDMASVFRGMVYWASGTVAVAQDSPQEAYTSFTKANVKEGTFVYTGTSRKTRHTVVLVTFNDPTNFYLPAVEYVENPDAILQYGFIQTEITAFGCASRGQAHRVGKWLLYTEWMENQSISFTAGGEGSFLRTGQVVQICDNSRSGVEQGGRIASVSSDRLSVSLDRPRNTNGTSFQFVVSNPTPMLLEGEAVNTNDLEELFQSQLLKYQVIEMTANEDGNLVVSLSTPLDLKVLPGAIWNLISDTAPQLARVLNVIEKGINEYDVLCLSYSPGKFEFIEADVQFEDSPFSVIQTTQLNPPAPSSAKLSQTQTLVNGAVAYKISISWPVPLGVLISSYQIFVKAEFGNFRLLTTTVANQIDYTVELSDLYIFQIFSVGVTGNLSAIPLTVSIEAGPLNIGTPDPSQTETVNKITGLELVGLGNSSEFIGQDISLGWRINSYSNSYNIGGEPNGANSGGQSVDFENYIIKIYDPNIIPTIDNPDSGNGSLILQVSSTTPSFVFDYPTNLKLSANRPAPNAGIPWRALVFSVYYRDQLNNISRPSTLYVENPRPAVPVLTSGNFAIVGGKVFITFPVPGDIDFAGYRVWISTDSAMVPSDTNSGHEFAPAYQGNANPVILAVSAATTYYVYWAEYDVFGTNDVLDVNLSAKYTLVVP